MAKRNGTSSSSTAVTKAMSKTTETTRVVKVTDFAEENPPAILISETVSGPGGRPRLFTQKIQVPDADLWVRLTAEVERGNTMTITAKTIWPDEGRYYTILSSFTSQKVRSEAVKPRQGSLEAVGGPS